MSLVDLLTSACFVGESVLLQTWQDLSHWIMSKISSDIIDNCLMKTCVMKIRIDKVKMSML